MEGKTCCVSGHRDIPADETAPVKELCAKKLKKQLTMLYCLSFWIC